MPSLPSAPDLALGKVFFIFLILCRVPPGQALVKEGFFNFLKNSLLSAIGPDTRQSGDLPSDIFLTLGKPFFFHF